MGSPRADEGKHITTEDNGREFWHAIAPMAFDKWVQKGCPANSQLQDWLEAEADFRWQRAEEAFKNTEALYHSLVENLPQSIFRKDREGRFTFVNKHFRDALGKPLSEILGKTDFDFYPPGLAQKYRRDDERVLETGQVLEVVEENRDPTGRRIFVQVVKTPLHDFRGRVVGTQCIFWDVTEKKLAEEALKDREQRLELALQAGCMGTWEWHIATGKVQWSTNLEIIHGFAPGTFAGTLAAVIDQVHPEDRDKVEQAITLALREKTSLDIEYRLHLADGAIRWVEGRGQLFLDQDGNPERMLGVCMDISKRKQAECALFQAEEALRKSHEMLQAIMEGTTDAIFVKDRRGRYLMLNSPGARLIGRTVAELMGKDDTALFSTDTAKAIMEGDQRVMASGEIKTYEDVGTAAGVTRTFLSTKGPYRDQQGNIIGLIGISRDITERKQAERRLAAEHAVTRVLAESANLQDSAPKILKTLCESLGWDVGVFWTLNGQLNLLHCMELWHAPTVSVPEFAQCCRQTAFALGIGLPGRAWDSGKPVWIADVTSDPNFPRLSLARTEGLHGAFAFPVHGGNDFLGVLEFFHHEILEPDEKLIEMLAAISGQISQFSERRQAEKHLHERDMEFRLAQEIQQSLLPAQPPALPGFALGSGYQSAQETGGDYLDFIPMPEDHLGIVIGDASGHGIGAALLMAQARAYLRAFALTHKNVSKILALANHRLAQDVQDSPESHFVTLLFARLHPQTRRLVYCNAGHPPAYVFGADGEIKHIMYSSIFPLGIHVPSFYPVTFSLLLEPGDLVFSYTDGILDAFSFENKPFGLKHALDFVRGRRHLPPADIVAQLLDEISKFSSGQRQIDDRSAVILKVE